MSARELALWGGLVALFVALVAGVLLLFRKARKAAAGTAAAKPGGPPVPAVDDPKLAALPAALPDSFSGALAALHAQTPGAEDRYALPWILLLGPDGSGKSRMVSNSGLFAKLGEQVELAQTQGFAWNFFPNGILIEVGGWACRNTPGAEEAWQRLSRLFYQNRPARPLDGIVLTVPADELWGDAKLRPDELTERGAMIRGRLRELMQTIVFRLPVYVVVTKCDLVPGFTEFAQELTEPELQQIFGWSNPAEDSRFAAEQVEDAFDEMRKALEWKQGELFAQRDPGPGRGRMLLFPGTLLSLAPPLETLLAQTLSGFDRVPGPLMRGIYCVGAASPCLPEPEHLRPLVPASVPVNTPLHDILLFPPQPVEDQGPFRASARLQPWVQNGLQIAFVRDLVLGRIFRERGLAEPLPQRFVSASRLRMGLQIASGVLACGLLVGTAVAYRRLHREDDALVKLLSDSAMDLKSRAQGTESLYERRTDAARLIDGLAHLKGGGLHSVWLPASLAAGLDQSIEEALVPAFQALVLVPFRQKLAERGEQLVAEHRGGATEAAAGRQALGQPADELQRPSTRLEDLPEYRRMKTYLNQVATYEHYVNVYNVLSTQDSDEPIDRIVELDTYLQGHSSAVPQVQASRVDNPYFVKVVRTAELKKLELGPSVGAFSARADALTRALYHAWIGNNPVAQVTDQLKTRVQLLIERSSESARDLSLTLRAFSIANSVYQEPSLGWTAATEEDFVLPANLAAVTVDAFPQSTLFSPDLVPEMKTAARDDFAQLAHKVDASDTRLTGPLVQVEDGAVQLSESAQALQLALSNLLNMNFMAGASGQPGAPPASPRYLTWDLGGLDAAASLPKSYRRYLDEDLQEAPTAVRPLFRRIAAEQLSKQLGLALREAMVSSPSLAGATGLSDIGAQIDNFSSAQGKLGELLTSFEGLGLSGPRQQLASASVTEAADLLEVVDRSFNAAAPYAVPSAAALRWTVGGRPSVEIFDASTPEALQAYLADQERVAKAYVTAVQPLLAFLRTHRTLSSPGLNVRLARWEALTAAMTQFENKRPGNSQQSLENFIATGVDEIRPTRGCQAAGTVGGSDYFALIQAQLRTELISRCRTLAGARYQDSFGALAELFNGSLARRFPFAPIESSTLNEANPQDVAAVFKQRDAAADLFAAEPGVSVADRRFLDDLQGSRPWFASILTTATAQQLPGLDVTPTFRVNRAQEIGGNQIIDWSLDVGGDVFRLGDASRKGHWTYGEPVTLTLRWALDAPLQPAPAQGQAHPGYQLTVEGGVVTYSFTDAWSLVRLVKTFALDPKNNSTQEPQDAFTLAFGIPELSSTQQKGQATVYVRLQMMAPGEKQTIGEETFPLAAPSPGGFR